MRGRREPREPEEPADRALHLLLGGGAVGRDGTLDLRGAYLDHPHVVLARGEADHAARVRRQQRRASEAVLGVRVYVPEQGRRLALQEPTYVHADSAAPGIAR